MSLVRNHPTTTAFLAVVAVVFLAMLAAGVQ